MAALKFEVYLNDVYLFEVDSPAELNASNDKVNAYLAEHPEINKDTAKIKINIKKEPCVGCGKN
jgi:hypothetical protein